MSSSGKLPALPVITSSLAPDVKQWSDAVSAHVLSLNALNPRANKLDAAVTFRDLHNTMGVEVVTKQDAKPSIFIQSSDAVSAVSSFNLRSGAITLTSADVTGALGFTPTSTTSGVSSVNTRTGAVTLTSTDVGLGNVDNTADLSKPVSTAQANADTAIGNAAAADATSKANAAQAASTPIAHAGSGGTAHAIATVSVDGFMSGADKTKLDGVAVSANNYSLPISGVSTLGGIKVGAGLSIDGGGILSVVSSTEQSIAMMRAAATLRI